MMHVLLLMTSCMTNVAKPYSDKYFNKYINIGTNRARTGKGMTTLIPRRQLGGGGEGGGELHASHNFFKSRIVPLLSSRLFPLFFWLPTTLVITLLTSSSPFVLRRYSRLPYPCLSSTHTLMRACARTHKQQSVSCSSKELMSLETRFF